MLWLRAGVESRWLFTYGTDVSVEYVGSLPRVYILLFHVRLSSFELFSCSMFEEDDVLDRSMVRFR